MIRAADGGVEGCPERQRSSCCSKGVYLLHLEDAVFEAMLEGWGRQQRGGRRLQPDTISGRQSVVLRFAEYTNAYPWQWSASELDEWMTS